MEINGPFVTPSSQELFSKEIQLDLRREDEPTAEGIVESIYVKLLQDGQKTILLLSSEHDLFFHYTSIIDSSNFNQIAQEQNLTVTPGDFGAFVAKLLNSALRDPRGFILLMFLSEDGSAQLTFTENFKNYKFLEILTLPLSISTEDVIRADITARYLGLKGKLSRLEVEHTQLQNLVKTKLPGILQNRK